MSWAVRLNLTFVTRKYYESSRPNVKTLTPKAITGELKHGDLAHLVVHLEKNPQAYSVIDKTEIKDYVLKPVLDGEYSREMKETAQGGIELIQGKATPKSFQPSPPIISPPPASSTPTGQVVSSSQPEPASPQFLMAGRILDVLNPGFKSTRDGRVLSTPQVAKAPVATTSPSPIKEPSKPAATEASNPPAPSHSIVMPKLASETSGRDGRFHDFEISIGLLRMFKGDPLVDQILKQVPTLPDNKRVHIKNLSTSSHLFDLLDRLVEPAKDGKNTSLSIIRDGDSVTFTFKFTEKLK